MARIRAPVGSKKGVCATVATTGRPLIITISFALMVLQAIAHLIRDIAILRGIDIPMPFTGEVDR